MDLLDMSALTRKQQQNLVISTPFFMFQLSCHCMYVGFCHGLCRRKSRLCRNVGTENAPPRVSKSSHIDGKLHYANVGRHTGQVWRRILGSYGMSCEKSTGMVEMQCSQGVSGRLFWKKCLVTKKIYSLETINHACMEGKRWIHHWINKL